MAGNVTNQQTLPMTVGVTYFYLNSFLTKKSLRLIIALFTKTDLYISNLMFNLKLPSEGQFEALS